MTWNDGPVGVRGEAWRRVDHVDTATLHHQRIPTTAWNAEATWLVTGEKKPIEGRVLPLQPFDPPPLRASTAGFSRDFALSVRYPQGVEGAENRA